MEMKFDKDSNHDLYKEDTMLIETLCSQMLFNLYNYKKLAERYVDGLTLLYNRQIFNGVLRSKMLENIPSHESVSFILMDIDWFKHIIPTTQDWL